MEALIILTILLIVCGGISVHRARQREKQDYEEYMARRISFNVSETNSDE
jgi:steroid 5-alpha reductase family enzyme